MKDGTLTIAKTNMVETDCYAYNQQKKEVCDEVYRGVYQGTFHDEGWKIDFENCPQETKSVRMKELITILVIFEEKYFNEDVISFSKRISEEINLSYEGIKVFIATKQQYKHQNDFSSDLNTNNVQVIKYSSSTSKSDIWLSLVRMVKTPYVLIGRTLHQFHGNWANIERSIRLLGSK